MSNKEDKVFKMKEPDRLLFDKFANHCEIRLYK
jgi:hypothetical protein